MRDLQIRRQLRRRLEVEFGNDPTALILDELGVCCGRVRADMVVINGEIKGFEIKSDQDTLLRLRSQASVYCRVFDTMSIVVAAKHLEAARNIVPRWWGVLLAEENGAGQAQLIWRDEALELLKARNLHSGLRKKPRKILWEILVQNFSLTDLRALVRRQLKVRRDWRSAVSHTQCGEKSRLSSTS
jgi:hypothetical protein